MSFDPETLTKLTTTLSGDVDLYNKVINIVEEKDQTISQHQQEKQEIQTKLEKSEENNHKFLGQISNLLAKIPVGNSTTPVSMEQKIEEVKNRTWAK
jgi:peptidoglycan hydrolase CwlO-like protein